MISASEAMTSDFEALPQSEKGPGLRVSGLRGGLGFSFCRAQGVGFGGSQPSAGCFEPQGRLYRDDCLFSGYSMASKGLTWSTL